MREFQHGGDVAGFAKELGCSIDEVLDLSSNINFVKPNVKIDIDKLQFSGYPDYSLLLEVMANFYKVNPNEIVLFNGANSAIYSIINLLNPSHITLYSPIYLEYKRACRAFDIDYTLLNRQSIKKPKYESLVVFVNPSTPDGKYYDIKPLLELFTKQNCTILIDESFIEFSFNDSSVRYLREYKNLYILRSISKYFGSAGVRVGAILSNSKNISNLNQKLPPFRVSNYDSIYSLSALQDKSFAKRSFEKNEASREILLDILKTSNIVDRVYPSVANFHLVKLKNIDAPTLQERLKRYGVMVRDCSNFDHLDSSYIRIALKEPKSMEILREVF